MPTPGYTVGGPKHTPEWAMKLNGEGAKRAREMKMLSIEDAKVAVRLDGALRAAKAFRDNVTDDHAINEIFIGVGSEMWSISRGDEHFAEVVPFVQRVAHGRVKILEKKIEMLGFKVPQ